MRIVSRAVKQTRCLGRHERTDTSDSLNNTKALQGGHLACWIGQNRHVTETCEKIELPADHSFRLLRWDRSPSDVQVVLSAAQTHRIHGEGTHWHYHEAFELTLFSSGSGTRFVGDRIESFSSGDLVLLGEHLPHYWEVHGPSSGVSVQWHFPPGHPLWMFPESTVLGPIFKAAGRGIGFSGRSAALISHLLQELVRAESVGRLAQFLQVLAAMAAAPQAEQQPISGQCFSLASEARHQAAMQAAMRFILTRYREEIRLQQLLEVTNMSKPTFSRQFKAHSGKSLSQFLQQVRLEAACRALAETGEPITDIALESGFSQVSFFNRVFQRTLGCTPSRFRSERLAQRRIAS